MRVCVIGTGYVGLVTSAVFSHLGHQVIGLDIDKSKINLLKKGKTDIYEPGLEALIKKNLLKGNLKFTTSYQKALKNIEVIFICVGTPAKKDGSYELKYVYSACQSIKKHLQNPALIVIKSTVPPSVNQKIKKIFQSKPKLDIDLASCPEFLKEGSALKDALQPSRMIFGVESKKAEKVLKSIHQKIKAPILITNLQSAQLIKYASNAFLAAKISFINSMAILCDKTNSQIKDVAKGLGLDPRISSSFLKAGLGYGGSCFPKDTWALISFAQKLGYCFDFLKQVDQVNQNQLKHFILKIKKAFKNNLKNKTLTILGLSFKPHTDDLREARSIKLIKALQKLGVKINAHDPVASQKAKKIISKVRFFNSSLKALENSDGLILVTEWPEYQNLDFQKIKKMIKNPVVFDGRNFYSPKKLKSLGFKYIGIGQS